ncbi:MAG: alpha-galactosidase [Armatimonadota bacterium]|nr:alpha-galactosidase [Armatimonadota bacterium]
MKVALIGAGSVAFSRRLLIDLMAIEEVTPSEIALMDVAEERLELVSRYAQRLIHERDADTDLTVTTDNREAVAGARYLVISIRVGGYEPRPYDIGIPLKYGVDQSVGDTIGPGGIFQGLRNAPALLEIADLIRETAPRAMILQHSNPMAINCWLMSVAAPDIPHYGLCHSVQGTSKQLARYMDVPYEELDCWVAGINHMAWFLRLERDGQDLYPLLRERMRDPEIFAKDTVRFEILRHFGYFVTESTAHMSEYTPWFRDRPEIMARFGLKPRDMNRMTGRWETLADRLERELAADEPLPATRSHEYTTMIMEAMETDTPTQVNVSVPNTGLITNLPEGCAVEVPCMVDRRGVHPCHVGDLPPQLAALNESNVRSQELAVTAALEGDRDALYQSIMLDPLTSAVLSLREIRQMVDEMLQAQKRWLPQFD